MPILRLAANCVLSALLAPTCAICDDILDMPLDGCVCKNCWEAVNVITGPLCDRCGDPCADARVCPSCIAHPRLIQRTRSIGEYDGTLRQLIHALKYSQRYSIAEGLAALMWESARSLLLDADCVAPVPLHRKRERERGFNQAAELARHLGPPMIEPLVRIRYTPTQVELAAEQRRSNVQNAFALRKPRFGLAAELAGLSVVLVDDVSTTSSTLEACASVLVEAGVKQVCAVTAARVVTRQR